jgi:hypothetical protein
MSDMKFDRPNWSAVVAAFSDFFEPYGEVTVSDDVVAFGATEAGTGLELHRGGTSRSFMPLHGLDLRWDAVRFDHDQRQVQLLARGAVYTYRVPPPLWPE